MSKQLFPLILCLVIYSTTQAQQNKGWLLEKMPPGLETDYALSALPPHLRQGAAVYLLDPAKGYYLAKQGTNGFSTLIDRTEWEHDGFQQDTYAAISFDSAISKLFLPLYFDVAAMRASGKYSSAQIKDSVVQRVKNGTYKVPATSGISYMLSPAFRPNNENKVTNIVMPHFMFYAPGIENRDIGGKWVTGGHLPFAINSGDALDKAHSIFNFIIIAAGEKEKAKIVEDNKDLLRRLSEWKSYFTIETAGMNEKEHHH